MKRLLPFVLLFAQISCGPTKSVVAAKQGLSAPPSELPTDVPPGLENLGDDIVQSDELDFYALDDVLKQNDVVQKNTVWLSLADEVNDGNSVEGAMQGVDLGLNTLSTRTAVGKTRAIGQKQSLLAVDLRDFFGTRANEIWKLIEDTAVLKIQSQTTRNKQLQFITGKRIPIMHAKIFLETAFLASNYYNIQQTPLTENEFWAKQGIDRQADFDAREPSIFMAAFQNSLIAPGHNRAIRRMENSLGLPCLNTYDVDSLFLVAGSNYFANPFPIEARRQKNFVFNAGEIICLKANGFMTFALYAANGNRADVAPTTVVVNTRAAQLGLDADIKPRDCLGCHANTMVLPVVDQMRDNIASNGFSAQDKLVGNIFFVPQAKIDAFTDSDNETYTDVLAKINISPGGTDSMNAQTDKLRRGYNLAGLAHFLNLSEGDFKKGLEGSQNASSQAGALLNGGELPFFALQDALASIIDDLNLFRDQNQ